jgi:hypothetical protein
MTGANSIEERVIEKMLAGSKDTRVGYLRDQMQSASVVKRSYTGCGFFTDLSVPDTCTPVPGEPPFELENVSGISPKLELGIGFILFIRRGRLCQLEAFTYGEPWPADLGDLTLVFTKEGE